MNECEGRGWCRNLEACRTQLQSAVGRPPSVFILAVVKVLSSLASAFDLITLPRIDMSRPALVTFPAWHRRLIK
jgi:hypothetical protein